MKFLTILLLLTLSFNLFAQDKIVGRYRDHFGSQIQLNADNTFKYTHNFDMSASWTKGIWTITGDTVHLHMIPTYDTLSHTNQSDIIADTLVLSTDEIPERVTQTAFAATLLSSGGQNQMAYPDMLIFRKERLFKIQNGKLVVRKQKVIGTRKKRTPCFFKSDE